MWVTPIEGHQGQSVRLAGGSDIGMVRKIDVSECEESLLAVGEETENLSCGVIDLELYGLSWVL